MEKRIKELDVLRVVAMLFVVTYHFGCDYGAREIPFFNLFCTTPNYDFGNIAVTIFLVLSGGLLYKKYGKLFDGAGSVSLKDFYLKRAKSIYPPFWIFNLYIVLSMARHFVSDGSPFYAGNPAKLLLTVFGFDGIAQRLGYETYFFCGEWFVGAIVVLYLLFPLLARIYQKAPVVLMLALVVLYGLQFLLLDESLSLICISPVTWVLKFCLGFVIFDRLDALRNWRLALGALALLLALTFVDVPGILNEDCLGTVAALAWFAVVFYCSPWLLKFSAVEWVVAKLAVLSYCVFLVQHVVISWSQIGFVKIFEKMQWGYSSLVTLVLLIVTVGVIVAVAWILNMLSSKVIGLFDRK